MRTKNSKTSLRVKNDLATYYGLRASEHEQIYQRDDSVRQREQAAIAQSMMAILRGRRVLEVACGTGYWTQFVANVAKHVVAIDVSFEMLEMARAKNMPADKVKFVQADAYKLDMVAGTFDACLANFWFSHVPKARVHEFLESLRKKLVSGSAVFMADNVYMPGVGGELITRVGSEDTFKIRKLSNTGSNHLVLKNYYDEKELQAIFSPRARELEVHVSKCFWWLSYKTI